MGGSPHMGGVSPMSLVSLEPGQWGLRVAPSKSVRFAHGLDQLMGVKSGTGRMQVLLDLKAPLGDEVVLFNVDWSKCYAKVDVVELSMMGRLQRHVLATVPLPS